MSKIVIEMPSRDWKKFSIQGLTGKIVKVNNEFKIEVEVMELPLHYVNYNYIFPYKLKDDLIDCTVIGDIGKGGFIIRILCAYKNVNVLE